MCFRPVRCVALVFALFTLANAEQTRPYYDMSTAGTAFEDSIPSQISSDTLSAIRLGVLAPFDDPDGGALLAGVRLAVSEANESGGYHGTPFALVPRSTQGPWGVTARQVAALAYDDRVWAVIGGVNGLQAHIAELVAEKAWLPVITPWATDLTIAYANVPWVFRISPDDEAQAELLWRYALGRGFTRIVVATEGTREGTMAQARLLDASRESRHPPALIVEFDPGKPEYAVPDIMKGRPEAAVLWGSPESAISLIASLRRAGFSGLVLLPSSCATPEMLAASGRFGEVVVAAPYDLSRVNVKRERFEREYRRRTGRAFRPSALMAYDSARMVIGAIRRAGLNRAAIQRAIAGGAFNGLSATCAFNSLGGTDCKPALLRIARGAWVRVKTPAGSASK